jgi:carbon-monoxide dehydrogenase small subunit
VLVNLVLNGSHRELDLEAHRTLAGALREECGLSSIGHGCTDGTCGACTVLVGDDAVRACLMLAVQSDGTQVRTVEGLAVDHPLRAALSTQSAARCGSCLSGAVMLAAGALAQDPGLAGDPERLRRLLAANVCRCADPEALQQAVIDAAAHHQVAG